MLLVFVVILAMAWLTARLLGRRGNGIQSKSMKVVERLALGVDRSLLIVQVGTRHYLFVSTRARMDFCAEVFPEPIESEAEEKTFDFRSIFERYSGLSSRTEPGEKRTLDDDADDSPSGSMHADNDQSFDKTTEATGIANSIRRMKNLTRK